jgi:hypothetical protein
VGALPEQRKRQSWQQAAKGGGAAGVELASMQQELHFQRQLLLQHVLPVQQQLAHILRTMADHGPAGHGMLHNGMQPGIKQDAALATSILPSPFSGACQSDELVGESYVNLSSHSQACSYAAYPGAASASTAQSSLQVGPIGRQMPICQGHADTQPSRMQRDAAMLRTPEAACGYSVGVASKLHTGTAQAMQHRPVRSRPKELVALKIASL